MSSITGLISGGGGGGTPINGRATLDLDGEVLYTDEGGSVWLKTGNVLTTGLENYPNAKVKTRPILSSATYDNVSFILGSGDRQFTFKPDGTRLYAVQYNNATLYQFDLSTPWDISTITSSGTVGLGLFTTGPFGVAFSEDGKQLYISGDGNRSVGYAQLNTAWDITGGFPFATSGQAMDYNYNGFGSQSIGAFGGYSTTIYTHKSYLYMPILASGTLYQFKRPQSRMYSERSQFTEVGKAPVAANMYGFTMTSSGDRAFMFDPSEVVREFDLDSGDVTTLSASYGSFDPTEVGVGSIYLKPDSTKLYIKQNGNTSLYQYSLTTEDYIGVPAETKPNEYLRIK